METSPLVQREPTQVVHCPKRDANDHLPEIPGSVPLSLPESFLESYKLPRKISRTFFPRNPSLSVPIIQFLRRGGWSSTKPSEPWHWYDAFSKASVVLSTGYVKKGNIFGPLVSWNEETLRFRFWDNLRTWEMLQMNQWSWSFPFLPLRYFHV